MAKIILNKNLNLILHSISWPFFVHAQNLITWGIFLHIYMWIMYKLFANAMKENIHFHNFLLFTSIHYAPDLVFIYLILQLL